MATNQDIIELVEFHKHLLDDALKVSQNLLEASKEGNAKAADELATNRERLVNVITLTQNKIENLLGNISQANLNMIFIEQLKAWQNHLKMVVGEISNIDQEIVNYLVSAKDEVSKEISDVFKNKEMFKGYNLKNVSR